MDEQLVSKKKVLICDDDRTHLLLMSGTLESQGYETFQAGDGEQALQLYAKHLPDMVLLDVNMPKKDGFEVCRAIRATESGKTIPILMITGSDDHGSIDKAFSAGATDFLPKPIKWPMIRHRIKYMLRAYDTQKDLAESEKKLRYLAYYDPLTNLPNRQFFKEQLKTSIALSRRKSNLLAVLFIDLDGFKRINDTLGHSYGDLVLIEVSKRLNKHLRESDVITRGSEDKSELQVARLGGDEFTVLLNDCGNDTKIAQIAKRLIQELSRPIKIEQYSLVVTASIGISICPDDAEDAELLLKYADSAMYEAKASGKNCFKLHSKDLNERSINRLKLEEYMREALETNMFELYYQPQIDPNTNTIQNAEALIRLHHPTLGVISPVEFIPIAEDTGLIIEIGNWVIKTACLQAIAWQQALPYPIHISINVSGKQLNQPNFVLELNSIIKETGVSPELLEIELTESMIMNNAEENIEKIAAIKALGIKLSIDDFGTGYSSLSYLRRFPIDTLKIDRSFVNELSTNDEDKAIVKTIAALAKALKLEIVAEGVETAEQLACVNDICEKKNVLIQGFFYSKPMPSKDFLNFINGFV